MAPVMTQAITTPNIALPDDFYAALLGAHDGLTDEQSAAFNARLILVMANQIGAADVLLDTIRIAAAGRAGVAAAPV